MSRTLEDVYNFMRFIVRKERSVFLTIDEAMDSLDTGQMDAFEEFFKMYGINQNVHDALRPFRIYYQFTSDSSGFVTFPDGYLHLIGQPFTVTGSTVNRIEFLNEDELPFALTSQLRPISNTYPIASDTSMGFSVYPQQTQTGFFTYLRRPARPVYATVESGRLIVFDATNSINLEWEDSYINNIIARALKYVSVNMGEPEVYNFASQYEQETK
jgi:hypothetical protein